MNSNGKKDRFLTGIIIIVSVIGILYFGLRAVSENSRPARENPFEYNIDTFKESGKDLLRYSQMKTIPLTMTEVFGIAVDADDRIFISGDSSVQVYNKAGELNLTFHTGSTARAIAPDRNGQIFLGMTDHVEVYDRKGVKTVQWGSLGETAIITSLTVNENFVFIADAGNHIVRKFDKTGNQIALIGEEDPAKDIPGFIIPSPFFDVSIDPDGFLWAVNPGRHSLENYTMDGDLRSTWGEYSMEIEGFCGCCNPTHIAILSDGKFVTSEKGIPRVKVYNRLGIIESVVAGPGLFVEGTEGLDLAVDDHDRIYVLDPVKKMVRIFEKTEVNHEK